MPRTNQFAELANEGDPYKLVALVPLGSKLRQNVVSGKSYWSARTPARPGVRSTQVYIGSDDNKDLLEQAWEMVSAQIAAVEATPEGRKLRELEALAGGPALARAGVVDIPILSQAGAAGLGGRPRPKR